jgi:putative aldouronate transport system permease protein
MTATATQTLTTSGPARPGRRSAAAPKPAPGRKLRLRHRLRRDGALLLMVLPAVALLIVFAYVPMLGNVIAWLDYSPYVGIIDSVWIGWDNFARVFQNATFWHAVTNTLAITAFQLVFYFPIPIILALLLNSVATPWIRSTIQSIV